MAQKKSPGHILMAALKAHNLTQEEAAAKIGIGARMVHSICKDNASITPATAIKLANAGFVPAPEHCAGLDMADPAELWAAISATSRVSRLRKNLPELVPAKVIRRRRRG